MKEVESLEKNLEKILILASIYHMERINKMEEIERQINNAIAALNHLKLDVTIENVLYMLQYSSDNTKLDIQTWTRYCKVAECIRKCIEIYQKESNPKSGKFSDEYFRLYGREGE